jgi:hypothetical protein
LKKKRERKKPMQISTNVRVCIFNAELLARSEFSFGRFSIVFLGPTAIAELVSKFHVALHASHAAFPIVT